MGLAENAVQCADRNLAFPRHYNRIYGEANALDKFDVATLLAGFDETRSLKSALDLAKGRG